MNHKLQILNLDNTMIWFKLSWINFYNFQNRFKQIKPSYFYCEYTIAIFTYDQKKKLVTYFWIVIYKLGNTDLDKITCKFLILIL